MDTTICPGCHGDGCLTCGDSGVVTVAMMMAWGESDAFMDELVGLTDEFERETAPVATMDDSEIPF
jgi:hypothetical protein